MSDRKFSVEEANSLLPQIRDALERLRDAQGVISSTHEHLAERAPTNGGGEEGVAFLDAITQAGRGIKELQDTGVVVRDPAGGLVDFPSERDGEEIFLCWRLDEDRVGWWHPTTSGFADRRPL